MTFDADGFRIFLSRQSLGQAPVMVRYVRYCLQHGITGVDDVDARLSHLGAGTRSRYRNALRRYHEFLEAA